MTPAPAILAVCLSFAAGAFTALAVVAWVRVFLGWLHRPSAVDLYEPTVRSALLIDAAQAAHYTEN
jgi:hypothetical protein